MQKHALVGEVAMNIYGLLYLSPSWRKERGKNVAKVDTSEVECGGAELASSFAPEEQVQQSLLSWL